MRSFVLTALAVGVSMACGGPLVAGDELAI